MVVAFVVIVVLPFLTIHSMVFLHIFVVLLLLHFLFQILDVLPIFRLPSACTSRINTPWTCTFTVAHALAHPYIWSCAEFIWSILGFPKCWQLYYIWYCHTTPWSSCFHLSYFYSMISSFLPYMQIPSTTSICYYIFMFYSMYMNIYCCSWICPSPYSIMTWIYIVYSWKSEVLVIVLHSF